MSRGWDSTPRAWDDDLEAIAERLADVDCPQPVNPARDRPGVVHLVTIPARLWDAVRADGRCQRDRARSEWALLATRESPAEVIADAGETQWRAMNPGIAEAVDYEDGVR